MLPVKVIEEWLDWDLFWRSAGFIDGLDVGVGGLGRMVRKRGKW